MFYILFLSSLFTLNQPAAEKHSPDPITHEIWNGLLQKYVTVDGHVNYKGFLKDKVKLQSYLDLLSKNPPAPDWTREQQMAYWINAYNAFTVSAVVNHYPIKSIKDLHAGTPFDDPFITIGGGTYTLNNIENNMLRKKFTEPRVHFAISCASKSCPVLRNEAYTAEKLEDQLNQQASKFINDALRNSITENKIQVSQIFNWYKDDFTKSGTLVAFLNKYSNIKIANNVQPTFKDYDWTLNE